MYTYCSHCREWVMATERVSFSWVTTTFGGTRLYYTCPICGEVIKGVRHEATAQMDMGAVAQDARASRRMVSRGTR